MTKRWALIVGVVCGAEVVALAVIGGAGLGALLVVPSLQNLGAIVPIAIVALCAGWLQIRRRRGGRTQSTRTVDAADSPSVKSTT